MDDRVSFHKYNQDMQIHKYNRDNMANGQTNVKKRLRSTCGHRPSHLEQDGGQTADSPSQEQLTNQTDSGRMPVEYFYQFDYSDSHSDSYAFNKKFEDFIAQ